MNHLATADVNADVTDWRVIEDQIAGLYRALRHVRGDAELSPALVRQ